MREGFEVQCWGAQRGGDAEFEWAGASGDGGGGDVCDGAEAADSTRLRKWEGENVGMKMERDWARV